MRPRVRIGFLHDGSGCMSATIDGIAVAKVKTRVRHFACVVLVLMKYAAGRICWHIRNWAFFNPVVGLILRRRADRTDFQARFFANNVRQAATVESPPALILAPGTVSFLA